MRTDDRKRIRIAGLTVLGMLVATMLLLPLLLQIILSDHGNEPAVQSINEAVDAVPGIRGVSMIDVALVDHEDAVTNITSLQIVYLTAETGESGYRAETVEVFRAVGVSLRTGALEVDRVILMPAVTPDAVIEMITASIEDINALLEGDLTRTDFLDTLEITLVEGIGSHAATTTAL
jgi:hypothetical protein